MAQKASTGMIVLGIFNLIVGLVPPIGGIYTVYSVFAETKFDINNRQLGPQMKKHVEDNVPLLKVEAFFVCACDLLVSLLLIGGSVCMFMGFGWGRWVSIGGAVLGLLTYCMHDVYQLALVRPAYFDFFDRFVPEGLFRGGAKFGLNVRLFGAVCIHAVLAIYFLVMSLCLALLSSPESTPEKIGPLGKRRDDVDTRFEDD